MTKIFDEEIDLGDTIDLAKPDVEDGVHNVKIVGAKIHQAKSGNTCLRVTFSTDTGVTLDSYFVIKRADGKEPKKDELRAFNRAIGGDGTLKLGKPDERGNFPSLLGYTLTIDLVNKVAPNGDPRPEVKRFLPVA